MKKIIFAVLGSGCLFFSPAKAETPPILTSSSAAQAKKSAVEKEEGFVFFTPPTGWRMAESNALPTHVRALVVGNGPSTFPPSLNLSSEPFQGTLRDYLKIVKNMNSSRGYEWKDLGNIRTEAGNGNLSQVDTKTQWGDVRLMHVILVKNGHVYILTASALKNEFSLFYKDFFAAMRSLKIANDVYDLVPNSQQRTELKNAANKLQSQWRTLLVKKQQELPTIALTEMKETIFKSEDFQKTTWKPFLDMIDQKYSQLGTEWLSLFKQKMEEELFNFKP